MCRRNLVPDLIKKLQGIEADVSSLDAKAQKRWGTEPPFEKWKI